MTEAFVARPAPWRILLLILGSLVFVLLGVWIAGLFGEEPRAGAAWIGWTSIIFFGACAIVGIQRLLDRQDQIVIGPRGIYWRRWSSQTIPWGAVQAVEERSLNRQRFLCIHLEDPSRFPSKTLVGRLATLNKGMGFGDIAINTLGTDRSFDELCDAFRRFLPHREPR